MDLAGEYTFDAPQERVWDALLDPNVLGSIMPGGQKFEHIGENQYNGVLLVKVGPVQGIFQGQISLADIKAPESYQMTVDGKGAPGFVKASGGLRLEPRDGKTFMAYNGQAQIGGKIASVGQRLIDSSARSIIRQSLDALNEYLKAQMSDQAAQQAVSAVETQVMPPVVTPTSSTDTQEAAQVAAPQASPAVSTTTPVAPTAPSAEATPAPTPAKITTQTAVPAGYKRPTQTMLAVGVARDVVGDFIPAKYRPYVIGGIAVVIVLIIWLIIAH